VREWFGDRLKATNEAAWRAAHSRLFEHLRDATTEGQTPTLADLAPLYHAIAHGCRAGRYEEALRIYVGRIGRYGEFYSNKKLGCAGSDLAAISWFFDRPYEAPAATLTPRDRAWVLSEASFTLRAQGRLQEALPAMRAALSMHRDARALLGADKSERKFNAAAAASNLSETELLFGDVPAAMATSETSVALADLSDNAFLKMGVRAIRANALHCGGEWKKAADLFAGAERRQRKWEPEEPLLYLLQGYYYCDLLLSKGQAAGAGDRAAHSLKIARRNNDLLSIALDTLTLGRTHLAIALSGAMDEPWPFR
jgi:hypothetical protein